MASALYMSRDSEGAKEAMVLLRRLRCETIVHRFIVGPSSLRQRQRLRMCWCCFGCGTHKCRMSFKHQESLSSVVLHWVGFDPLRRNQTGDCGRTN